MKSPPPFPASHRQRRREAGNGESGVAFVLAPKLLHPRPKAMGVDFRTGTLMTPLRGNAENEIGCTGSMG